VRMFFWLRFDYNCPTSIKCKLKIDKDPGDKWDVTVSTDDGAVVTLREAFDIDKSGDNAGGP